MRFVPPHRALIAALVAASPALAQRPPAAQPTAPIATHVQVLFDTTQAAVALDIIEWKQAGNAMKDEDWRPLIISDGYRRLRIREAEGPRAVTDSAFKDFLLSDSLGKRAVALRSTFEKWKARGVRGAVAKAVAYLPADARLTASVYIAIKPHTNTFVYDIEKDPAIFVYLNHAVSAAQFENVVAHEMHHIGFTTLGTRTTAMVRALPDSVLPAAEWSRAFGEGFAMLAAAGGPDINPHATSAAADRARWNAAVRNFNRDLKAIEEFFLGIVTKRLRTPEDIGDGGTSFYGAEGPWYTVGWKMAATIEKQFGRKEVVECMVDPHRLLDRYNAAAAAQNKKNPTAKLALWSPELVAAFKRPQ